jgi:hypothetical protein
LIVGAKGMCMGRDKWLGGELGEDGNVYGIPGATRWSRKSYEGKMPFLLDFPTFTLGLCQNSY